MIQVQLEVRAGATCFRVSARAASVQRAVSVAGRGTPVVRCDWFCQWSRWRSLPGLAPVRRIRSESRCRRALLGDGASEQARYPSRRTGRFRGEDRRSRRRRCRIEAKTSVRRFS
jgi:hypothetical protein